LILETSRTVNSKETIAEKQADLLSVVFKISVLFCSYNWSQTTESSNYLFVELNVSEYRVNSPRLTEHGAERQRETDTQRPRLQLHRRHGHQNRTCRN